MDKKPAPKGAKEIKPLPTATNIAAPKGGATGTKPKGK